jgi:phospholipid/cholesterol/gamma-HCH transport system substrate-binding protein
MKVGVLATVAIVMLVLGYNLMRGKNIFSSDRTYYIRYDNAEGIAPAGRVRYKGMNVGHVQTIELASDGSEKIVVSVRVTPELKIPKGSTATVASPDLIGAKIIRLDFTNATEYYEKGDTLIPGTSSGGLRAVQSQAEALIASLDSAIVSINGIFNSETKQNLQKSIKSIESTLSNLDKSTAKVDQVLNNNVSRLDHIFANIESITSNLNKNQEQINAVLSNLSAITDSVKRSGITAAISSAKGSLAQVSEVMRKINSGQGSMALLINDDKLYKNLETSSKALDALLADLKANPGRYLQFSVFGKKDKSGNPAAEK